MTPWDETDGTVVEEPIGQLARRLAHRQVVMRQPGRAGQFRRSLQRLERSLVATYRRFQTSAELREAHPRAAEWLLDNSYLTRGALRQVDETLGRGYLRDLPKLVGPDGAGTGLIRVRSLADAVVAHARAELAIDELRRFVRAYQEISNLSIGELWALPAMLQVALLESLATTAGELKAATAESTSARHVAACIESLRLVAVQDWRKFVEAVSRVEEILRRDPARAYAAMDSASRDRYRQAVEEIARGSADLDAEMLVAEAALRRSREAADEGLDARMRHVGYYLLDGGREELERELGCRPRRGRRRLRWILRHARPLYFGLVGLVGMTALAGLGRLALATQMGVGPFLLALAAGIVPATTVAVSLVNWLTTHVVPPRVLPKLEIRERIPEHLRTVVALPVLIADRTELKELLGHLEVLRHANPLRGLRFVMLSDLPDAPQREMAGDPELVEEVRLGIRELNASYHDGSEPFCLLHRDRSWNPSEGCWMGWERKRGKLEELNRFLLGEDAGFTVREGSPERLRGTRFVITLDADTVLPPEAAGRLIGTLGHPMNQPVTTPDGRTVAGFSILQPRIDTLPRGGAATAFSQLGEDGDGLDLYSHAASDVYQDLFGQGLYAGKGIYDVRTFHASLRDRVPENAILSHDLFEGLHGRVGLVSDIRVFEEYPAHVMTYLRRLHRWIRGDWQLLPWLAPRVPGHAGRKLPSSFAFLDRWKILDNLRRSLLAPSLFTLLLLGWLTSEGPWMWVGLGAGVYALPVFLGAAGAARRFVQRQRSHRRRSRPALTDVLRNSRSTAGRSLGRWLMALMLLPHEMLIALDAIGRTLFRLVVSRHHLLEWTSAAHTDRRIQGADSLERTWARLWHGPVAGVAVVGLTAAVRPDSLAATLPLATIWMSSPAVAELLSRPLRRRVVRPMSSAGRRRLRLLALHTWIYFERFIDSEDNWLPPDNYRESHEARVARRTSPTNVGMMLGAAQAAYDFGFIDVLLFEATLSNVLDSLELLERHRGHLLNWYSTTDLRPLEPRYVSTVDSGNLAAALIAVGGGLDEAAWRTPLGEPEADGLIDALTALAETAVEICARTAESGLKELEARFEAATEELRRAATDPSSFSAALARLEEDRLPELDQTLLGLIEAPGDRVDEGRLSELRTWSRKVRQHVGMLRRLERRLLPWLAQLRDPAAARVPTDLGSLLGCAPALRDVPRTAARARGLLDAWERAGAPSETQRWRDDLRLGLAAAEQEAERVLAGLTRSRETMRRMVDEMSFGFLFDPGRELFHIGYDVTSQSLDPHHYDLLASEARIASLLAIARGDVPVSHWLQLGRPFGRVSGARVLLSWSATMFEYMLPVLFTRLPDESLLAHACRQAVHCQIRFAEQKGVPWGISESAYHGPGADVDYPYRAFGVPELGLGREPGERLVVAPYATVLALPIDPRGVEQNLERLCRLGMVGPLGLYESLDFGTPVDHVVGEPRLVQAYMAHHQGMILIAAVNHLKGNVMVERFHADPRVAAVEHLLHERVPWQVPARRAWARPLLPVRMPKAQPPAVAWGVEVATRRPEVHLLSNGRYSVLVTARGAGGSSWDGLALTRWRADPTHERRGSWIYLCDSEARDVWSTTHAPTVRRPDSSSTKFAPHMVEFHRRDAGIFVRTCVVVAPDDDIEIRHVSVTNETGRRRRLGLASYSEIVLGSADEDRRHPAYSKLFVEGEILEQRRTLLFRRRPRSADERPVHLGHALVAADGVADGFAWDTDRASFLGRGGDAARPAALRDGRLNLSRRVGATLDPICSLACEVELSPYETIELAFVTAAAASRAGVIGRLDRYRSLHRCTHATDWARERSSLLLDELDIPPSRLPVLQRMLSGLVHRDPALSGEPPKLDDAGPSRSGLWKHGISGDLPILLVRVGAPEATSLVEHVLRAHAYLRRQGARFDLVILDRGSSGYAQPLRDRLHGLLEHTGSAGLLGRRGGVHIVGLPRADETELRLLESSAWILLDEAEEFPTRLLEHRGGAPVELPEFVPMPSAPPSTEPTSPLPSSGDLSMFNGFGGFSPDGREYVIRLEPGVLTPAPWANIIANRGFGCVVTEAGGGYTWAGNAGENRLTPWRNDPVTDQPGEVVYLRDEETGEVWSITPAPAGPREGPGAACEIRHGAGYTTFRRLSHGLGQELTVFCAPEDPVKILKLRLSNLRRRQRRITATYYVEWVLGANRETAAPHVVTDYEADLGLLLARNPFHDEFGERVSFIGSSHRPHGVTADRTEFLGRDGDTARPAGMYRIGLSGKVGELLDPCAAYQVHLDIGPGDDAGVHFVLGQGQSREHAVRLARGYREPEQVTEALEAVERTWDELLGTLSVKTPEPALDVMLNRWLLYQTVSSRLWARTGLYQSSGAFGFRDQLQDVAALLDAAPRLTRGHMLEAAARQFEEGDVLHWWQPGTATGVRTRCSDDLLWLPYVTALYVKRTGDDGVLEESVPYLRGEPLREGEADRYGAYASAPAEGSLYDHCVRAIERGTTRGEHGLPLIGGGDWNDGLDRVGREGRGESVWLAWFLATVLDDFAPVCEGRGDHDRARTYRRRATELRGRVENVAWDGGWYHRAYYDDGTPLGSAENREGRIDAISQAWSALAGGDAERARTAMDSVAEHLILDSERVVLLLAPPFDRTDRDPGYIKGYPPGVRENGGQYTHAAAWVGWAFAALGDSAEAGRILGYLNPALRAADREAAERYRVEPYVVAADVYGAPPHVGRGGWTWYTGSAAWLYRFAVEAVLGLRREGASLHIEPCLPPDWEGYVAELRFGKATYRIDVRRARGAPDETVLARIRLDGRDIGAGPVSLADDGVIHEVEVRLAPATTDLARPDTGVRKLPEELAPGAVEVEHTADLGMEVEASSLEELFRRAAAAMMALVRERDGSGLEADGATAKPSGPAGEERLVELERESDDVAGLLVRWLRELLYLQEVEDFVYGDAEFDRLDASGLRARVRQASAPAAPIRELKGVTYHGLEVERRDGSWHARVIFDI